MKCQNCGMEINERPCPYCGTQNVIHDAELNERFEAEANIAAMVLITAPSEVIVEADHKIFEQKFDPDVTSGSIVATSLESSGLTNLTPKFVRDQLVDNINRFENSASDIPLRDEIHEHSFELNLGFFKYTYKRIIKPRN